MRKIFISYRREDSEGQAGRLFDDLARHFGEDSVFMDVAGIEAGRDFRRVIDEHVASCGVLLAMIGKSWVDAKNEAGQRRLDDARDFVRLETASALKRDIPVIPVLVHGAHMPRAEQLPPDLAELAYRNGVELTHARWDSDVQVLIKALNPHVELRQKDAGRASTESPAAAPGKIAAVSAVSPSAVPERAATAPAPSAPSAKVSLGMIVGAASALIAITIGGYAWYQRSRQGTEMIGQVGSPEEASGQTAPSTTAPPAGGTASDLCKELNGKSINFIGNNYHAVIGSTGIKLEEISPGTFRFETEVVFSGEDVKQQFHKPLRDKMNGVCRNNNVITLDRTLQGGTVHHHTGSLKRARTGRIEMEGDFQDGKNSYAWSGWTANPAQK
jgi:TIR domain